MTQVDLLYGSEFPVADVCLRVMEVMERHVQSDSPRSRVRKRAGDGAYDPESETLVQPHGSDVRGGNGVELNASKAGAACPVQQVVTQCPADSAPASRLLHHEVAAGDVRTRTRAVAYMLEVPRSSSPSSATTTCAGGGATTNHEPGTRSGVGRSKRCRPHVSPAQQSARPAANRFLDTPGSARRDTSDRGAPTAIEFLLPARLPAALFKTRCLETR